MDWLAFARTGEPVRKLFRAEEDVVVRLVVDASAALETGDPPKVAQRLENTLRVLRNTPGVESASFASGMP